MCDGVASLSLSGQLLSCPTKETRTRAKFGLYRHAFMSYLIYTFDASNPIHLRSHTMLLIDPVFCCPISTSCCSAQARRYVIYGKIFALTLKLPKYLNNTLLVTVGGNLHQNVVNQSRFKTWNCLALHSEKITLISSKKIPQLRAN